MQDALGNRVSAECHFMAEGADIYRVRPIAILPVSLAAGVSMADMGESR